MSAPEVLALGAIGLVLGRWVNLSIDRLPPPRQADASNPAPRRKVSFLDLVPLVSFAGLWRASPDATSRWLRWRPPLVELITALMCGVIAYRYGLNLGAALLALYGATFIHLAVVDLEHTLILNVVVVPALVVGIVAFPFTPLAQDWGLGEAYLRSAAGTGLGFTIMLLVYVVSRGGMGAGDVKLAAFLGGALGFPLIIAGLLAGFMAGGLVGLALLALRLRGRRDAIPYGPALVAGATVALLAGPGIFDWYFSLFH
jgi:leader peptidase (prepilin peptidase)/N-methyltransferase